MDKSLHLAIERSIRSWLELDATRDKRLLAKLIGVTPAAISFWVTGRNPITHPNAVALIRALARKPTSQAHIEKLEDTIAHYERSFPDRRAKDLYEALSNGAAQIEPKKATRGDDLHDWPGPVTVAVALLGVAVLTMADRASFLNFGLALAAIPLFASTWFFEASLRTDAARRQVARFFQSESYVRAYGALLSAALDTTDRWFVGPRNRDTLPKTSVKHAWTVRLFAKALLLALIYPLAAMLFQWLILDRDVWFGDVILLHDTQTFGKIIVVAFFFTAFVSALFTLRVDGSARYPRSGLAVLFALAGLLLLGLIFGPEQPGIAFTKNWFMGTLLFIIVFGFILLCHFKAINLIVGPAMGVVIGAAIQSINSAEIEALAAYLAQRNPFSYLVADGAITMVLIVCIATVCAVPLTMILNRVMDRPGIVTPLIFASVPIFAVWIMSYGAGYLDNPYYFIVLGILPTVNAVFDFTSIGLTRWALRCGLLEVGRKTLLFSAFDLIAALLIFLGLGCFCVSVFHLVNLIALNVPLTTGVLVINLYNSQTDNLFHQISAHPDRYVWLYLTFLTTLLPTLLHACVAIWALGPSLLSEHARWSAAQRFRRASETVGDKVVQILPLAIWTTAATSGPLLLILSGISVLSNYSCQIGYELMNVFIRFLHVLTGNPKAVEFLDAHLLCTAQPPFGDGV